MSNLNDLLETKRQHILELKNRVHSRKINEIWEEANEFCSYLKIDNKYIPFILRCFKLYGKESVLSLKSWLKDADVDRGTQLCGLIVWKLKENERNRIKSPT